MDELITVTLTAHEISQLDLSLKISLDLADALDAHDLLLIDLMGIRARLLEAIGRTLA